MSKPGFAERLLKDWPAKVISLGAALLLFFFYRLNRLEERYLSLPLAVEIGSEYVPASQYPRSVRVTLKGESSQIFALAEGELRAFADLSVAREEGVLKAPIRIEKLGSASGVDPLEILVDPAEVTVAMERRASRVVPVTPSFRGYLEPGYELVALEMTPSEIEIAGPAGAVARTLDVSTDFIELSGRKADFSASVRLLRKDPLLSFLGADSVSFGAKVQLSVAERSYEDLEIVSEGLSPAFDLEGELPRGTLRVQSSKAELRSYEPGPGSLYVDLSDIERPGTYSLPVQARPGPGIAELEHAPSVVQVRVLPRGELP